MDAPAGLIVGRRSDGVVRFLGIPFAEAPIGDRRFAAPEPRSPFTAPFDAVRHGATPQRVPLFETTTIPEPSIAGDDILNLSVVAPERRDGPLPVLVWVHGGGFLAGSPASPWYDGRSFARDGVITVTVSYRLGIDGFAPLDGVQSNLGLRDVLLALDWVQHNIAAFGGDPSRVTIGGQSAGGGVVLALLSSPLSRGLFHGAVSISGGDFQLDRVAVLEYVRKVAARLGVEPSRAGFASVSEASIQTAVVATRGDAGGLALGPVIGDDVLPSAIADGLRRHNLDVPLLLGATGDEFEGPETRSIEARLTGRRVTDVLFRAPVPRVARARSGARTWTYTFEWPSPVSGAATHCIDVPFFFDVLDAAGVTAALGPEPPQALATAMHGDLVRFIRTGEAGWPLASGQPGETSRNYGGPELVDGAYDPVLGMP